MAVKGGAEGVDQNRGQVVAHLVGGQFGGQFDGHVVRRLCPQIGPQDGQARDRVDRQVAVPERVKGEQRLFGK